jgi:hypothetical protein
VTVRAPPRLGASRGVAGPGALASSDARAARSPRHAADEAPRLLRPRRQERGGLHHRQMAGARPRAASLRSGIRGSSSARLRRARRVPVPPWQNFARLGHHERDQAVLSGRARGPNPARFLQVGVSRQCSGRPLQGSIPSCPTTRAAGSRQIGAVTSWSARRRWRPGSEAEPRPPSRATLRHSSRRRW